MLWKPIVIGIDSSNVAPSAVVTGMRIAQRASVGYTLVHGTVPLSEIPTLVPISSVEPGVLARHLQATARRDLLRTLRGNVPPEALNHLDVRIAYPLDALRDAIDERDAGLLVMGGKRHTVLGRLTAGSLSHRAVRTIDIPTMVTCESHYSIRRILVAIDLSSSSRPTLDWGARFAELLDTEMRVLHVVEPSSIFAQFPVRVYDEQLRRRHAEQRFDEFLASGGGPSRPAANLRVGRAAVEITHEARSWGADLVVVGSHGKRWIDRLLIGSTTEALLNTLPSSLLVIPTAMPARARAHQQVASIALAAPN